MELRLHHIIHLYNVLRESDGKENCTQLIEEELNRMFGINDEHDCNVVSMNSLNIHDANHMQSHTLGDAMFDEDDIFSPPRFDVQICYNDCMPLIYDYYNDESGFEEVMTLFSDESTILDEASIDYDNKVAIYDDYGDDMYAIKNNDNHGTFIMILIFNPMIVTLLSLLPLLLMRINLLMWRVISFLCFCVMKRMLYVMVILLNFFMMLLKIIMREELMLVGIAIISSFLSLC